MIKELPYFTKSMALLSLLLLTLFIPSLSVAGSEVAATGTPQKPASEGRDAKPMIKISYLMSRKAGMTREEFLDYWSNQHPAAGGEGSFEALGVKRYIQLHSLDIPEREAVVSVRTGLLPEFDGVAEIWIERDFLEKEWPTKKVQDFIKKFYADELNFVDWSRSTILVSKELVYMP
ncbi:EthD domain-containing protein [Aliamphritea spongicola]|uniref:EthD domain-containing protein n=1 Tax=Aliamphritea spongicola TaxID=707589 RepID=UPI00196AB64A|nr:EthD domain-containing protein [Aliamphritea spongicola]MBN3562059.1 EthD domain-containing protein [Aliamphritea spongicola]